MCCYMLMFSFKEATNGIHFALTKFPHSDKFRFICDYVFIINVINPLKLEIDVPKIACIHALHI